MSNTTKQDIEKLRSLGQSGVVFTKLETFVSHSKPGDSKVSFLCTEFTCRCPKTKQPDWATIEFTYIPDKLMLESKSVKLYLETFRDKLIFHEHLAQKLLDDLIEILSPIEMRVTVNFNSRGGIAISATAKYEC